VTRTYPRVTSLHGLTASRDFDFARYLEARQFQFTNR